MSSKNHIQKFLSESRKKIRRKAKPLQSEVLRTPVVATTTLKQDKLILPRSFRELLVLILVFDEFREDLAWEVYLDLEEQDFSYLDPEKQIVLNTLLQLRTTWKKLLFLHENQDILDLYEIFGELGKRDKIKFSRKVVTKVVKPVFRRGYNDKGTLSPSDHRVDLSDVLFREKVEENYQQFLQQQQTILQTTKIHIEKIERLYLKMSSELERLDNTFEGNFRRNSSRSFGPSETHPRGLALTKETSLRGVQPFKVKTTVDRKAGEDVRNRFSNSAQRLWLKDPIGRFKSKDGSYFFRPLRSVEATEVREVSLPELKPALSDREKRLIDRTRTSLERFSNAGVGIFTERVPSDYLR